MSTSSAGEYCLDDVRRGPIEVYRRAIERGMTFDDVDRGIMAEYEGLVIRPELDEQVEEICEAAERFLRLIGRSKT